MDLFRVREGSLALVSSLRVVERRKSHSISGKVFLYSNIFREAHIRNFSVNSKMDSGLCLFCTFLCPSCCLLLVATTLYLYNIEAIIVDKT